MGKPVIAVDIDDVIFPFVPEIIKHFNTRLGATITLEDFSVYHFSQVWGSTEEEANAIVAEFLTQDAVHLLPVQGAQQAFSKLSRDFTIVLVTARNGLFAPSTQQWLEAHFKGLFNDVIFAGNPYDTEVYLEKGVVCEQLGASLLIDDSPANLRSALDHGIGALLFGLHNWNRQHDLPADIARCESWEEAAEYIYKTFPVPSRSDRA